MGTVRPSATTNLQNVKAIRKALSVPDAGLPRDSRPSDMDTLIHDLSRPHLVRELLGIYGLQALCNFDAITNAISHASNDPGLNSHDSVTANLDGMTSEHTQNRQSDMQYQSDATSFDAGVGVDGALDSLFGTHLQESTWMRDWIDDLQHFPE